MAVRNTRQLAWCWGLLGVLIAIGALLRFPDLARRPMHNDEANQAYKTGVLLDTGAYRYDPSDHHGPTLYYLTLPLAWARGQTRFAETTVGTYRGLTVLCGLLLIPLLFFVRDALGTSAVLGAGLFTAVSPAMVYFNRFYIQESLLVLFTFALLVCLWRYRCHARPVWALGIGFSAGLMHATKETCVLAWAALAGAVATGCWLRRRKTGASRPGMAWSHAVLALGAAIVLSVTLFSSFFTYWRGPLDSLMSYVANLDRATGGEAVHRHPPWFYLRLLTYSSPVPRLSWGEDIILLCAGAGALAAWCWPHRLRGSALAVRSLSIYALLLTAIYSVIPYKTPWCLLSFWHGWILLAGVGLPVLLTLPRRPWLRVILGLLTWLGVMQLAHRSVLASYRYATNQRNPYVYAQTGTDFMRLIDHIEDLKAVHPRGNDMRIHVVAAPDRTWPLPWYLRDYSQVGYWHEWTEEITAGSPDVIIADLETSERLSNTIRERYIPNYYGLRPEVLICGYFRSDAWDRLIQARTRAAAKTPPEN